MSCIIMFFGDVSRDTSPIIRQGVKKNAGIFAQRAMVDQARHGLCYQIET